MQTHNLLPFLMTLPFVPNLNSINPVHHNHANFNSDVRHPAVFFSNYTKLISDQTQPSAILCNRMTCFDIGDVSLRFRHKFKNTL